MYFPFPCDHVTAELTKKHAKKKFHFVNLILEFIENM